MREDKNYQNINIMNKIIEQCKYEVTEKDIYLNSSKEIVRIREKIDLSKFRAAYLSTNVNEDIKHQIEWTKVKKEEKKIREEIDKKQIKKTGKKGAGSMTQEELQEFHRKRQKEERDARKRHLERAYAGIDKDAK